MLDVEYVEFNLGTNKEEPVSRIYFATRESRAEVFGSERAHFAAFIGKLFTDALAVDHYTVWSHHPLKSHVPDWVTDGNSAALFFKGFSCNEIAGHDAFSLQIKTALDLGSEPVRLAALIHAACELHGYFHPDDLDWLTGTIKRGLEIGFYRQAQGWDSVLDLIANTKDCPIVMSYSVCDIFPGGDSFDQALEELAAHLRLGPQYDTTGLNAYQLLKGLMENPVNGIDSILSGDLQ